MENTATRQIRVRQYKIDELIAEEIHTQKLDDYSKNELVLMLERAGFEDINTVQKYLCCEGFLAIK